MHPSVHSCPTVNNTFARRTHRLLRHFCGQNFQAWDALGKARAGANAWDHPKTN